MRIHASRNNPDSLIICASCAHETIGPLSRNFACMMMIRGLPFMKRTMLTVTKVSTSGESCMTGASESTICVSALSIAGTAVVIRSTLIEIWREHRMQVEQNTCVCMSQVWYSLVLVTRIDGIIRSIGTQWIILKEIYVMSCAMSVVYMLLPRKAVAAVAGPAHDQH